MSIEIDGQLRIPEGYEGSQEFLTPIEVIRNIIESHHLNNPNISVLDPFAGFGTIPAEINIAGGNALGIEIEGERARLQFPHANLQEGSSFDFDYLGRQFDFIFTSIPFTGLFDPIFMEKVVGLFKKVLKPGGTVLIDTVPMVEREGRKFSSTEQTKAVLETAGFVESNRFVFFTVDESGQRDETIILEFTM